MHHARYPFGVAQVSIGEMGNHGGEAVDRAARGEQIAITRAGKAVAQMEMRGVPRAPLFTTTMLARWRALPVVAPAAVRADVDAVVDPSL